MARTSSTRFAASSTTCDAFNVMLVDGMRMGGNRYGTQTNNIESVEVLKGPSSVLYGRGAVGGAINIVRKKPQAARAYDFGYRGGRFNTHQVSGGATGPIGNISRSSTVWTPATKAAMAGATRGGPAERLAVADVDHGRQARTTIHQTFNRDRFDGDGGVPLDIVDLPSYKPDLRFSLPQDQVLVEDSQTTSCSTATFPRRGSSGTPSWRSAPAIAIS